MYPKREILFSMKTGADDMRPSLILAVAASFLILSPIAKASEIPAAVAAKGKSIVETVHAQGVQIYECKAGTAGNATWQFREPLATLLIDGKTVGRHFAGPGWELDDGSRIKGKVAAQAPGATDKDIPILLLDVIEHQGNGRLSEVTTVQRLETNGGAFGGSCEKLGALHLEPYSADYLFLK
jgi:hypothetical protein